MIITKGLKIETECIICLSGNHWKVFQGNAIVAEIDTGKELAKFIRDNKIMVKNLDSLSPELQKIAKGE